MGVKLKITGPEYKSYLNTIIKKSKKYIQKTFDKQRYMEFLGAIKRIDDPNKSKETIVLEFIRIYEKFVKEDYQKRTALPEKNEKLIDFIQDKNTDVKIVWGDSFDTIRQLDSESIHLMVTSPPYYNARKYSQWPNLNEYLNNMRKIIHECYRVLDNHRVFVFNIGDTYSNDNLVTKSVWGARRLPLGCYLLKIFEEEGFTFVDDFIWDKGEVQSKRHKSGDKPYPFYQYPANCYEHIMIFHKHRLDKTRYPCPVCGSLKVNGNTQSEIGLQSWECKNLDCFKRSKSNRGKRFSLKSSIVQRNQQPENVIQKEFLNKWRRDFIKFSPVIKINSKGINKLGHTAPFPEDIPKMAIELFSYKGERVLDPFAGSFTTTIAARKLGRVGIGFEINKKMFRQAILKNIKNHFKTLNKVGEYDLGHEIVSIHKGRK